MSGVPGTGVRGTGGLDTAADAAAEGEFCCGELTANIFNTSWAGRGKIKYVAISRF